MSEEKEIEKLIDYHIKILKEYIESLSAEEIKERLLTKVSEIKAFFMEILKNTEKNLQEKDFDMFLSNLFALGELVYDLSAVSKETFYPSVSLKTEVARYLATKMKEVLE